MKNLAVIFTIMLAIAVVEAQQPNIDSLKYKSAIAKEDTNKVKLLNQLSLFYAFSYADTSIAYGQNALDLAEKLDFEQGILDAEFNLTAALITSGNYPRALGFGFKALALAKKINRPALIINANAQLGNCYDYLGEHNSSITYPYKALNLAEAFHTRRSILFGPRVSKYESARFRIAIC